VVALVAKFLHILAHNVKNRTTSFFFHHSGGTINRHFHSVLKAVITLEKHFFLNNQLKQKSPHKYSIVVDFIRTSRLIKIMYAITLGF